jgi:hypothetical protein
MTCCTRVIFVYDPKILTLLSKFYFKSMSEEIEKTRLKSIQDLPVFAGKDALEFIWHVCKIDTDYWSIVTIKNGKEVFRERAYSCDGKYHSIGQNRYQEVCGWMKKKYGNRFGGITKTYQDYDCGCYFED